MDLQMPLCCQCRRPDPSPFLIAGELVYVCTACMADPLLRPAGLDVPSVGAAA